MAQSDGKTLTQRRSIEAFTSMPTDLSRLRPDSFRRMLVRAVVLPFVLTALLALLFSHQIVSLTDAARWVDHTGEVIGQANGVQRLIIDTETGLRGYLLSQRIEFLEPYYAAQKTLDADLSALRTKVADNPLQSKRVEAIIRAYNAWNAAVTQRLQLAHDGLFANQTKMLLDRKARMDEMRSAFREFIDEEIRLREERRHHSQQTANLALYGGGGAALILGLILTFLVRGWLVRTSAEYQLVLTSVNEAREWLATTLSSIGDAVIVAHVDGTVAFLNTIAEELTEWSRAEAVGKPLNEVFKIVNMYSRQVVDNPVAEVIRRGVIVGLANHTVVLGRNGTESCIEDSAAPIRDANGVMLGVVLVFRDVTDTYRVKRELEESENRFRRVADAAPVMIWTSDTKRQIDWMNAQWISFTGVTFEESAGLGWLRSVHPDDQERVAKVASQAFDARTAFRLEYRLRRRDGVYRWVLDSGSPRIGSQGEFMGYVGSCIDIEEQKKAIEGRDQFLSVASHELRTPLTSLKLETQMRKRGLAQARQYTTAQWNSLLEGYDRQILRLTRLIDDMLDMSRIHSGRLSLQPSRFDLAEMVDEVVERIRPQFEYAEIKLTKSLHQGVEGDWDRFRMEQVVTNLLSNAIKYGGSKPVHVEVEKSDGAGVLRVGDQGEGIAPHDQARIFDRFERLGDPNSSSGLGLGLFIVREILTLHRGSISVDSAPGEGATFTVTLPLSE